MKRYAFPIRPIVLITLVTCLMPALNIQAQPLKGHVYNWQDLKVEKKKLTTIRPVVTGSTRDLSFFEVSAITITPGEFYIVEKNEDIEQLIIIKEGLVRFKGETTTKVGKGSVAWILPGDQYDIENIGSIPATFYVLRYKSRLPKNEKRGEDAGGSFIMDWESIAVKPTDKGERREFFDRATAMFERFEMHVTTLNKKDEVSHAPHTHRAEEIVLLINGNVEMQIGDEHVKAYPGTVVFLASEFPHALKNVGDEPCTYFAFQWQEANE